MRLLNLDKANEIYVATNVITSQELGHKCHNFPDLGNGKCTHSDLLCPKEMDFCHYHGPLVLEPFSTQNFREATDTSTELAWELKSTCHPLDDQILFIL